MDRVLKLLKGETKKEKRPVASTDPEVEDLNLLGQDDLRPLLRAARRGDEERVNFLIKSGVNVNLFSTSGETALHCSAEKGHYGCLELLTKAGANVNETLVFHDPCLIICAKNGYEECVKLLLLGAEADVNALGKYSHTAESD